MATVKSFKADNLSFSPLLEQSTKAQNVSFDTGQFTLSTHLKILNYHSFHHSLYQVIWSQQIKAPIIRAQLWIFQIYSAAVRSCFNKPSLNNITYPELDVAAASFTTSCMICDGSFSASRILSWRSSTMKLNKSKTKVKSNTPN